jgi:hypothetical protein
VVIECVHMPVRGVVIEYVSICMPVRGMLRVYMPVRRMVIERMSVCIPVRAVVIECVYVPVR